MNNPEAKRWWSFTFVDENDVEHEHEGAHFMGNDKEAEIESKRLADIWESDNHRWCFKIIRNSHGIVEKPCHHKLSGVKEKKECQQ